MNKILIPLLAFGLGISMAAAETPAPAAKAPQAASKFSTVYEGQTYSFPDEASLTKWKAEREASIYHQIGGKLAMDAAIEIFYKKMLADDRVKHFFDDVDMVRQRTKQNQFLSAAFGGPVPYVGKDLRKAHAKLPGLNDTHFNAVAEHLQATLVELKVPQGLIDQVMTIAGSTRADVLNRAK